MLNQSILQLLMACAIVVLMCTLVCRKAEQCKETGNTLYKSKDYAAAVQLYTEAIGESSTPHFGLEQDGILLSSSIIV